MENYNILRTERHSQASSAGSPPTGVVMVPAGTSGRHCLLSCPRPSGRPLCLRVQGDVAMGNIREQKKWRERRKLLDSTSGCLKVSRKQSYHTSTPYFSKKLKGSRLTLSQMFSRVHGWLLSTWSTSFIRPSVPTNMNPRLFENFAKTKQCPLWTGKYSLIFNNSSITISKLNLNIGNSDEKSHCFSEDTFRN